MKGFFNKDIDRKDIAIAVLFVMAGILSLCIALITK